MAKKSTSKSLTKAAPGAAPLRLLKVASTPEQEISTAEAAAGTVGEVSALEIGRPFEGSSLEAPAGFAAWLQQAQALGLETDDLVWELHIVQGRSLAEAARLLGIPCALAVSLHGQRRTRLRDRAPKSEADFQAVREEVRDRLVSIIEDASRAPDDPRLLGVRQRACDQLAELYGLKMQRRSGAEETAPLYAQPEEIRAAVEQRALQQYGRLQEVEAARQALNGE